MRCRIRLDLREKIEVETKPAISKRQGQEFRVTLQNKFAVIIEKEGSVDILIENLTHRFSCRCRIAKTPTPNWGTISENVRTDLKMKGNERFKNKRAYRSG